MKILKNGVAVIEGDTHVSKWVQEQGTLKIAERYLAFFRQYIPAGGVVVDAGAMIGDHTVTYSEWVGDTGIVYAFEPNLEAFACLTHNTKSLTNVILHNFGLSDSEGTASMKILANAGASYLSNEGAHTVGLIPLDNLRISPRFIKIDVEGHEVRLLHGAERTIMHSRPVMLIEVNAGALDRAGTSPEELLTLITQFGYDYEATDVRAITEDTQYDVLCVPVEKSK